MQPRWCEGRHATCNKVLRDLWWIINASASDFVEILKGKKHEIPLVRGQACSEQKKCSVTTVYMNRLFLFRTAGLHFLHQKKRYIYQETRACLQNYFGLIKMKIQISCLTFEWMVGYSDYYSSLSKRLNNLVYIHLELLFCKDHLHTILNSSLSLQSFRYHHQMDVLLK